MAKGLSILNTNTTLFTLYSMLQNKVKGRGHGKICSKFIVKIFSLGGIKTHDTFLKFLKFVKVVK